MDCEAVEQKHIAHADLAANPAFPSRSTVRDFRHVTVRIVPLIPEAMRTFQNAQWPNRRWTIVKRNPNRKALGVPAHEAKVLVSMDGKPIAIGEDQSPNRFWVDQKTVPNNHRHQSAQRRMVRQQVERFQVEDPLVGLLERWVRISAGRADFGHTVKRIEAGQQPSGPVEYPDNIRQHSGDVILRQ